MRKRKLSIYHKLYSSDWNIGNKSIKGKNMLLYAVYSSYVNKGESSFGKVLEMEEEQR